MQCKSTIRLKTNFLLIMHPFQIVSKKWTQLQQIKFYQKRNVDQCIQYYPCSCCHLYKYFLLNVTDIVRVDEPRHLRGGGELAVDEDLDLAATPPIINVNHRHHVPLQPNKRLGILGFTKLKAQKKHVEDHRKVSIELIHSGKTFERAKRVNVKIVSTKLIIRFEQTSQGKTFI